VSSLPGSLSRNQVIESSTNFFLLFFVIFLGKGRPVIFAIARTISSPGSSSIIGLLFRIQVKESSIALRFSSTSLFEAARSLRTQSNAFSSFVASCSLAATRFGAANESLPKLERINSFLSSLIVFNASSIALPFISSVNSPFGISKPVKSLNKSKVEWLTSSTPNFLSFKDCSKSSIAFALTSLEKVGGCRFNPAKAARAAIFLSSISTFSKFG